MPQNFPTPRPWAGGGAGSVYTGGGSAATYNPGDYSGGFGGAGSGGASLEGQLGGLLDYIAKRQDYLYRRNKQDSGIRDRNARYDQEQERNRALAERQRSEQQTRNSTPPQAMPQRDLMQNKNMLDSMLTEAPRGTNQQFFNLPAAAALTFGKSPFPNGWDTYAALAGAGKLPGEAYTAAMKQVPSGDAVLGFNQRFGGGR